MHLLNLQYIRKLSYLWNNGMPSERRAVQQVAELGLREVG